MKVTKEDLIELGYKEFDVTKKYYLWFLQRRVENEHICDLNEALRINLYCVSMEPWNGESNYYYEMFLNAFKGKEWVRVEFTHIHMDSTLDEIKVLEEKLIKAFSAICT